jgi:hypothetical protein
MWYLIVLKSMPLHEPHGGIYTTKVMNGKSFSNFCLSFACSSCVILISVQYTSEHLVEHKNYK